MTLGKITSIVEQCKADIDEELRNQEYAIRTEECGVAESIQFMIGQAEKALHTFAEAVEDK